MTLSRLAAALCGKIIDHRVVASWPHGDRFRQVLAWPSWQAPDGIVVVPVEAREYVLERLKRLV